MPRIFEPGRKGYFPRFTFKRGGTKADRELLRLAAQELLKPRRKRKLKPKRKR